MITIKYKKINDNAQKPYRKNMSDAGFDLYASSVEFDERYGVWIYGTGLAFQMPIGVYADVRPRSSIYKTGLVLSNSAGVIDNEYRGEVKAVFYQGSNTVSPYKEGDRFCQIIFKNMLGYPNNFDYWRGIELLEVDELDETERGCGGFGSTGQR